jgi:DNA-directed RNA polymerase specialized sigma24 family protein
METFATNSELQAQLTGVEVNALLCGEGREVQQAFRYLMKTCYRMVSKYFHTNQYRHHDLIHCGELFADALTELQQRSKQGQSDPVAQHCSYLREAVHRMALRQYRRLSKHEPLEEDSFSDSHDHIPPMKGDYVRLEVENAWGVEYYAVPHPQDSLVTATLLRLGADCRRLITAHVLDQQPFDMIAERTGKPSTTLRDQFQACLRTFRIYHG